LKSIWIVKVERRFIMESEEKNKYIRCLVGAYRHFLASIVVIKVNRKSSVDKNKTKHSESEKNQK